MDPFFRLLKREKRLGLHYYGDMVRALFMLAALVMVLSLPLINNLLPVNTFISILIILGLGFLAGLTNPEQKWTVVLDTIIALVALSIFEYYAIGAFLDGSVTDPLFYINQLLAIIFLFALYYSTKSVRGMMLRKEPKQ